MSEIKALEKLRESSHLDDNKWTLDSGEVVHVFGSDMGYDDAINWGEKWRKIADEIEAEIAERFMELPVDADGVPIHVGDELSVPMEDFTYETAEAIGISPDSVLFFNGKNWAARWASCVSHADAPQRAFDSVETAQRVSELEAELEDARAEIRKLERRGEYMVRQIAKAKEALR